jgi:hypothetical protein
MNKSSRRMAIALLLAAGSGVWAGAVAQSASADAVTVLELFTSQGCSSCPSADQLFKQYAGRTDIVALSYSVDYWDYLGWKDTLASPRFSERQRAYGKSVSNGQVYTPQMVVNGTKHAVGSSKREIDTAVSATRGATSSQVFRVDANRADSVITIQGGDKIAGGTIWLVTVRGPQSIAVKRGENSGRTLTYYNVVREIVEAGTWNGSATSIRIPDGSALGPDERYAVLIQRGGGPVLGAGWVQ